MYEYECHKCGKRFEVEQRMTDDALTIHDECGGDVVKVFGSVGVVYKGSGFYKTDSRSSASVKAKSESSDASPKTEKKAETKSESKPAAPAKDTKSSL